MIDPFDPRGVSRYDSPQVDQIRSQEQPSPADHHWNVWSVTVVLGLRAHRQPQSVVLRRRLRVSTVHFALCRPCVCLRSVNASLLGEAAGRDAHRLNEAQMANPLVDVELMSTDIGQAKSFYGK